MTCQKNFIVSCLLEKDKIKYSDKKQCFYFFQMPSVVMYGWIYARIKKTEATFAGFINALRSIVEDNWITVRRFLNLEVSKTLFEVF